MGLSDFEDWDEDEEQPVSPAVFSIPVDDTPGKKWYAFNLYDLMGLLKDDFAASAMVRPLLTSEVVECERHPDGDSAVASREIDEYRIQCVIQVLRKKYPDKSKMRVYFGKGRTWERI